MILVCVKWEQPTLQKSFSLFTVSWKVDARSGVHRLSCALESLGELAQCEGSQISSPEGLIH